MEAERQRNTELRWAFVRLLLGVLQIAGATASFLLLIQSGVHRVSVSAVLVTGFLSILSHLLFRPR